MYQSILFRVFRIIVSFSAIFFLLSCNLQKVVKFAKEGYISQKEFVKKIPFKYINKHIFIDVEINTKTYTFLFDTGFDVCALDTALVKGLNYNEEFTHKISGSSIKEREIQFVKTEKISIENLDFIGIGASLIDLSFINENNSCNDFKVAGIIGANLLRKAYWEIDYDKKVIKFSDKLENLTSISNHLELNLISKGWGLTKLDVEINNRKEQLVFDTGSNGVITLPDDSFKEYNILEYNTTIKKSFKDKKIYHNHIALVDNVKLNSSKFSNTYISFEKGASKLVGNRFLENYNVVIDWNKNKLFLRELNKQSTTIKRLPIQLGLINNKIIITGVQKRSIYNSDLLDKEIIRVNEVNFSSFSKSELCHFWEKEYPLIKASKKMEIETSRGKIYKYSIN